jgi:hypothetical protein
MTDESQPAPMWSLASRVHDIIFNEAGPPHLAIAGYLSPRRARGGLTERERALCNWGVAFGVTLALALAENPQESLDALYRLACNTANIVEHHQAGAIPPRARTGEAIDRVITAFENHGGVVSDAESEPTLVKLQDALQALTETYGVPCASNSLGVMCT